MQAISSFALYGFPESHAASFALIAYASAYLKCNYLAAFTAAILNNQPMGFYQPFTLIKDAQRHGLKVLPMDVTCSDWLCTIEELGDTGGRIGGETGRWGKSYVTTSPHLRVPPSPRLRVAASPPRFTSWSEICEGSAVRNRSRRSCVSA